jgi:hypothetical protein
MKACRVLGVYREEVFSPGKVRDDAAILDATLAALDRSGFEVSGIKAESLDASIARPDQVLSMAQSEHALGVLEEWQQYGVRVINTVESIRNCYRKPLTHLLQSSGVCMPRGQVVSLQEAEHVIALGLSQRIWLKRGDVHAMQANDVVSLQCEEELAPALDHFRHHHIDDILVQEHVEGRVIKFYGVGNGGYFRAFSVDNGEQLSARIEPLLKLAWQASRVVGLEVYGGDAVLTKQGEVCLIDLNDWPSFSRCSASAAESIAHHLLNGK